MDRYRYFDLKIHASIVAFNIADYTMTNTFFFESLFFLHCVPKGGI
jgi:hypothetical protein